MSLKRVIKNRKTAFKRFANQFIAENRQSFNNYKTQLIDPIIEYTNDPKEIADAYHFYMDSNRSDLVNAMRDKNQKLARRATRHVTAKIGKRKLKTDLASVRFDVKLSKAERKELEKKIKDKLNERLGNPKSLINKTISERKVVGYDKRTARRLKKDLTTFAKKNPSPEEFRKFAKKKLLFTQKSRLKALSAYNLRQAEELARSEAITQTMDFLKKKGKNVTSIKTWRTLADNKVRDTHRETNGQRRKDGALFNVGGEAAEYPRDEALSPKNRYGCRCFLDYYIKEI